MTNENNPRILALLEEVRSFERPDDKDYPVDKGDNVFRYNGADWLVLTSKEAYKRVYDYIRENLWCMDANFLQHFAEGDAEILTAMIKTAQEFMEESNETLYELVKPLFPMVVENAIMQDGYGLYIAVEDGEEREQHINGVRYFIYKQ